MKIVIIAIIFVDICTWKIYNCGQERCGITLTIDMLASANVCLQVQLSTQSADDTSSLISVLLTGQGAEHLLLTGIRLLPLLIQHLLH